MYLIIFILLDLVIEDGIVDWIRNLKGLGSTARLRNVDSRSIKSGLQVGSSRT